MKFSGLANMVKKILPFGDDSEEQDFAAEQLDVMKERIRQAKKILTDPEKTSYNIVMIPEYMSIYESERALHTLKEYGIPVKHIIVNQLIPPNSKCDFCNAKSRQQKERLKIIKSKFKNYKILQLPLFKEEVHGKEMLMKLAKELYG